MPPIPPDKDSDLPNPTPSSTDHHSQPQLGASPPPDSPGYRRIMATDAHMQQHLGRFDSPLRRPEPSTSRLYHSSILPMLHIPPLGPAMNAHGTRLSSLFSFPPNRESLHPNPASGDFRTLPGSASPYSPHQWIYPPYYADHGSVAGQKRPYETSFPDKPRQGSPNLATRGNC